MFTSFLVVSGRNFALTTFLSLGLSSITLISKNLSASKFHVPTEESYMNDILHAIIEQLRLDALVKVSLHDT